MEFMTNITMTFDGQNKTGNSKQDENKPNSRRDGESMCPENQVSPDQHAMSVTMTEADYEKIALQNK